MWGVILRFLAGYSATRGLDELIDKVSHFNFGGSMVNVMDFANGGGSGGGGSSYWGPGPVGPSGIFKKKRRRRARLTQSELTELMQIKNLLGKTAAANVLPYYMGRGR